MSVWRNTVPKSTDRVSKLASVIRNNKQVIKDSIEQWWAFSDDTTNVGLPRLSTDTGSARAYVGTPSLLSTDNADDGAFFVDSTNKRLYVLDATSDKTVFQGSSKCVILGGHSATTLADERFVLRQIGLETNVGGSGTVTFDTAYAAAPVVEASVTFGADDQIYLLQVTGVTTTDFDYVTTLHSGGVDSGNEDVMWRATGEASLV